MKILRVKVENFLSWCGETEFPIGDWDNLVVITGKSGSGKSSLFDAITFGLFGKPVRNIPKAYLVTRGAREGGKVEIEFEVDGEKVLVSRSVKPGSFHVFVNDEPVDVGASKDALQAFLEKEKIGIGYEQFVLTMMLTATRSFSFFTMTPAKRREFVDALFGLGVLEKARKVVVRKRNEVVRKINVLEGRLEEVKSELENERNREIDVDLEAIEKDMEEKEKVIGKLREALTKLKDKKSELDRIYMSLISRRNNYEDKRKALVEEVSNLVKLDVCPTCFQKVSDEHKKAVGDKIQAKIQEIASGVAEVEKKKKRVDQARGQIGAKIDIIEARIAAREIELGNIRDECTRTKTLLERREEDLGRLEEKKVQIVSEMKKARIVEGVYSIASDVLSEEGVRSIYHSSSYAYVSEVASEIVREFGLFVDIVIDDDGNARFIQGNEEVRYESFSDGERSRLNLAVALSWVDLVETSTPFKPKTLFLDEVTQNLDFETVKLLQHYIWKQSKKGKQFILISHNEAIIDSVPSYFRVVSDGGCSRMEVV